MDELTTNRLWDTGPKDCPSQYARMILGTPATPPSRVPTAFAPTANATPTRPANAVEQTATSRTRARPPTQRLSKPAVDRFMLWQLVAADLIVLVVVSGASSLFFPAWALPRAYLPIFAALVTLFGFCEGLYERAGDPSPAGIVPTLARSTLFAIGLIFIAAWGGMRPLAAVTIFASSLTGLVLGRRLRQIAWKRQCRKTEARRILIVGGGPVGRSIAQALRNDPLHRATVCGFVDDEQPLSPAVLGRIADLDWLARGEFIDEVILALPGQPAQAREAAEVAFRNHLDIRAVPELPPGPWPDSGIDCIGEVPVVTLHRERLPNAALFLKRSLDVLKEELRARNQRHGPIFKIDDDPRITRIGHIIRRYSLDELPQLWNVLRGEMSLVGPRPHPVDEVSHYELHHYRRLDVKPGITGLWQITARDCPSFELNMHLDLTYIENWSLRLDLRILASTVRVLFAPEGA